jgi:hypothetical protein
MGLTSNNYSLHKMKGPLQERASFVLTSPISWVSGFLFGSLQLKAYVPEKARRSVLGHTVLLFSSFTAWNIFSCGVAPFAAVFLYSGSATLISLYPIRAQKTVCF